MKLWQKDYDLDKEIERFTVGSDYLLDQRLVKVDAIGSIAHARMLSKIGILTEEEFGQLKGALVEILRLSERGEFAIELQDEDVHTRVENYLTEKLGALGKKIHTARSRNDQILLDIRLFTKEALLEIRDDVLNLCHTLLHFSRRYQDCPMPGRTHTQPAMPSSVGLWSAALMESLLDDLKLIKTAYELNDQSPLGSAASYGVPLDIDRQLTSDLLGFKKVQNNVLYANNSRGKMEATVLFALSQVMIDLSKLANELIMFSLEEFGYFTLPVEFCPGSSIMPQKKNPGGMELVRGKTSTLLACLFQIMGCIKALPYGYNQDFQETKEPFLKGLEMSQSSVRICSLVLSRLKVNADRLINGCRPEIYATDRALELVSKGVPFRDAYHQVAANLGELEGCDPEKSIRSRKHIGATGNMGLEISERRIAEELKSLKGERAAYESAIALLLKL